MRSVVLFLLVFHIQQVMSQKQTDSIGDQTQLRSIAMQKPKPFSGQVRYFYMATGNRQPFTDYYAHALSVQGKYELAVSKPLRAAAGGAAIFNLASSDLTKIDAVAKRPSRYEAGLFNLREPDKWAGFRLEELYLQYALPKGWVRLGSQLINTPFINPQDGRMRPTFVSGLYTKQTFAKTRVEGGYIAAVLPRSINRWYGVGHSIGLNPQGVNTDGTPADYAGNLSSKGILLAGISQQVSKEIRLKAWEQYVDNIFNTALLQADLEKAVNDKLVYLASLQYVYQVRIQDGGAGENTKGYFQSGAPAQVMGAMTGLKGDCWEVTLNYTRILAQARFLMPREWGRESFFTFMPRERNEGFGDIQAFVVKTAFNIPKTGFKTSLQLGHFLLPDVKNAALNKYGMPSYNQVNAELRYTPTFAPRLDLQFLYVYKDGTGNTYQNPAYVFNKVKMSLYNLVINYNW
jgi:hypothetical protein